MEIENYLIKHYDITKREIARQIKQRSRQLETAHVADHGLSILRNIQRRAEGRVNGK